MSKGSASGLLVVISALGSALGLIAVVLQVPVSLAGFPRLGYPPSAGWTRPASLGNPPSSGLRLDSPGLDRSSVYLGLLHKRPLEPIPGVFLHS